MSNNVNTELLERVAEFIDNLHECDTYFEVEVDNAIKNNDLEEVRRLLFACCNLCGRENNANCNNANCDYKGGKL